MATALASAQLLEFLAERKGDKACREASRGVERAVAEVLAEGKTLTYDLGGTAKCSEVGTAVAKRVRPGQ